MDIMVRLGEPLWRATGSRRLRLQWPGSSVTIADVLARLTADYPAFEAAYRGDSLGHAWPFQLFVNARRVPAGEADRWPLGAGDVLYILLPAAGGAPDGPLPRAFYHRPTLAVARDLLGRQLVRVLDGRRMAGRIVEVEAYVGEEDLASHAACGRTGRNQAMYGPPGRAYVYQIYGIHHCLNVVTEAEGFPAAVLIRAVEPLQGLELIAQRRPGRPRRAWTDGPGKLCQALDIDRRFDGHDLTAAASLWIELGQPVADLQVVCTPRVNVRGDARARTVPWRFLAR